MEGRSSWACGSEATVCRSLPSRTADRRTTRPQGPGDRARASAARIGCVTVAEGQRYRRGVHEVGDGLYAYLQPDGGWGWSNAGLVTDGESTLLIDTLFDRRLTERMLAELRSAVPAAARIGTLVNTHANGDHCYGNQLLAGARIVASARTAAEMSELPPAAMASLVEQAPNMGALGAFFLECFSAFDFRDIELVLPQQTFKDGLTLSVGERELHLIDVGPAHTRGGRLR